MGRKHKKFIDKKHDVVHTFKLVQRSQKDPLIADECAPQNVLVDTEPTTSQKEELHKYGVYFDDDYDYLQHLRGAREAVDWDNYDVEVYTIKEGENNTMTEEESGLVLPSSVFESYLEEPIGLLNKAAPVTGPQPDLDPDIVAELEDENEGNFISTDNEEEFPDDFVALLNAEGGDEEEVEEESGYGNIHQWLGGLQRGNEMPTLEECDENEGSGFKYQKNSNYYGTEGDDTNSEGRTAEFMVSDEEDDQLCELPPSFRKRQGARSDSSRTSASSATVPRSELLSRLDEKFEKMYEEEYNDDQLGALDGDVIEGSFDVDSEVFQQAVQSTLKQFERERPTLFEGDEKNRTVNWVKENIKYDAYMEDKDEIVKVDVKTKPAFDCESIISTYSNTRNRPHLIDDRNLFPKNKSKLTMKAVKEHNRHEGNLDDLDKDEDEATLLSCISALSFRPKNETPEERRDRKLALKELRRERRKEKKLNKLSFKEELKKQKNLQLTSSRPRIVTVI